MSCRGPTGEARSERRHPLNWFTVSAALTLPGVGCDPCETTVVSDTSAGEYFVTTYHRDCGATTPYNTQVAVRRRGEPLDLDSQQVLAVRGLELVSVCWIAERELRLGVELGRQVYRRRVNAGDVIVIVVHE